MTDKNNLELWDKVEKTDTDYVKKVSIGKRAYSAIDPMYQLKNATAQFGRYGATWGLKNLEWDSITIGDTILATLSGVFFTPEGEVDTANSIKMSYKTNSGYITVDEDYRKKLMTNTLSKELSRLGFNADVFLGKFDDERYVQSLKDEKEQTTKEAAVKRVSEEVGKITDVLALRDYYNENKHLGQEVTELITKRSEELKPQDD